MHALQNGDDEYKQRSLFRREYFLQVAKGFEFQTITRGVLDKEGALLSGFSFEAYFGGEEEGMVFPRESFVQGLPLLPL